jgi:hypothetical protein
MNIDIAHAVERVQDLQGMIKHIETVLVVAEHSTKQVSCSVFVYGEGRIDCPEMSREQCIDAMRATLSAYQAEISRLQPIIDMANLALKGLST